VAIVEKTIGSHSSRDYSSIALWIADLDDNNIYNSGDSAHGICYDDAPFHENSLYFDVDEIGSDLSEIKLTVADGNRHNGIIDNGVTIYPSDTLGAALINIIGMSTPVTLEWLCINGIYQDVGGIYSLNSNVNIRNCIIHDFYKLDNQVIYGIYCYASQERTINVLNNVVYNIYNRGSNNAIGIYIGGISSTTINVINNTVINIVAISDDYSLVSAYCYYFDTVGTSDAVFKNLIGMNASANPGSSYDFSPAISYSADVDYNMSSDATASGSHSLTSKSAEDQFVSVSPYIQDLRLKYDSDAINAGTNIGSSPTNVNIDISGRDRVAEADIWDIGAYEFTNSEYLTLFIHGHDTISNNLSLFIYGLKTNSIYLFIEGHGVVSKSPDLYISGYQSINNSVDFYIGSLINYDENLFLYTYGDACAYNSYINLFTYGVSDVGRQSIDGSIPLVVYDSQIATKSIILFIKNTHDSVIFNENLNLFISGENATCASAIPLYVCQEGIYVSVNLYVRGDGTFDGASVDSESLSLFIYRPNISDVIPLVIYNNNVQANNYTTLYIDGIYGSVNNSVNLSMPNVNIDLNSYVTLTLTGIVDSASNVDMSIPNVYANVNDNIPLFICHNGNLSNSYITSYIFGAYLDNNSVDLTIPNVIANINEETMLYIHGY